MKKVEAIPIIIKGQKGYDIRVNDQEATVQDYMDAINDFILESKCYRSRQPGLDSCYACNLCCQERIPVTLLDAYKLGGEEIEKTLEDFLYVYVEEQVVDITMGLDEAGKCVFLDPHKGICTFK